ncbi:hypothetical protein FJ872_32755 [Mesorhizobium sp. B2-5-9]|uniref:hypothetical protein n=1 Tax=Mesorhizobium sp. B2-5-9 TaxID=2589921 RepID=UPI001126756D|nr:hypothetical protein [Mesorhizobium sp. B2-5-9]TPJ96072.1 hypothetical protein FJ872_32755 [Mesorhizobium sp. B2-5-9]
MILHPASIVLAIAAVFVTSALAQKKTVEQKIEARSGEPIQLGIFGHVTPDCTNKPFTVRVANVARNGTIRRASTTIKKGRIPNCPDLVPAVVVFFYESKAGFTGNDSAAIEVKTDAGQIERHEYDITVE